MQTMVYSSNMHYSKINKKKQAEYKISSGTKNFQLSNFNSPFGRWAKYFRHRYSLT